MPQRRNVSYNKAYTYQTSGSAALAPEPLHVDPQQPLQQPKQIRKEPLGPPQWRRPVERGAYAPMWAILLLTATVLFIFAFTALHMRSEASGAQKQVTKFRQEIERAQEINGTLEIKIAKADDPDRIHAVATNWLKMRIPTPDEIRTLKDPMAGQFTLELPSAPKESGGMFRQLLSFFGL